MPSLTTMCLGQLCGVSSMEFHWIEEILSYTRGLGDCKAASTFTSPPSFREFMRLFLSIPSKHLTFINVQLWSFTSSRLCLSVNSFLNFEDGSKLKDQRLMAGAAIVLGDIMDQTQSAIVSKVLEVNMEFNWHLVLLTTDLAMSELPFLAK
ncbi:hypothetical protein CGCS363_v014192 [Colletotrichum siamense]|uniref:uncharacterized protein n=1 Tax=Colletotrichum siamense TaxID=690259 RepID=UPI0018725DF1|nr:uncharacterized protein CGCS363_v014192 [Colletotrichum siamense]KAF5485114.1 hypothetical protein CGCS363_v014192 [Colletotrichum siamense]